jgi:hypothetical protein
MSLTAEVEDTPLAPASELFSATPRSEVRRAKRSALTAVVLGLLVELLFDGKPLGISFPLFTAIALGAMALLAGVERRQKAGANLWLVAPIFFFAAMVCLRDNASLVMLDVAATLLLALTLAYAFAERPITQLGLIDHAMVPLKAAALSLAVYAGGSVAVAARATSVPRTLRQWAKPVARGLLLAIPVFALFTSLLCSADPRFRVLVADVFDFGSNDLNASIQSGAVILGAAFFLLGLFGFSQRTVRERASPAIPKALSPRGGIEGITIAVSINLLFVAFSLMQAVYLFWEDPSAAGNGITFSEYARSGFFELLAVSIMTLALILALVQWIRPATPRQSVVFKGSCSAMAALVLILLASALKRMMLYEEAYGYTSLRLYSHVFMFALGAALVWRAATFWWKQQRFAFGAFCCGLGFLIALNLVNPDAWIARKNLERASRGGEVDFNYLTSLSADAIPALAADSAEHRFPLWPFEHKYDGPESWPSFNFSRWSARRAVEQLSASGSR